MAKRKSLSKKTRFEVFKRDNFKCQYCNSSPPNVALEIDHIHPVSKGGVDELDNLITACFECNRGKSDRTLDIVPESLIDKSERIKIANDQFRLLKKESNKKKKIIESSIDDVEKVFNSFYDDYGFTSKFRITVKKFNDSLGVDDVIDSMERACFKFANRTNDGSDCLKYFCGICWNKIKEL